MQLAKTQNTQGKIDTGSGCWGCWGTVAVDINDLICICICTHVRIYLYIRSNPTAVARLRPKLRKSSQHCHFSACFSFFFFFYGNLSRNNFEFAGAQARARIWHVAKRNNNINSNKTLGMRGGTRGVGGRGATPIATVGSVSQTETVCLPAAILPASFPLFIHSLIPKDANCCFYYAIFLSISGLQST